MHTHSHTHTKIDRKQCSIFLIRFMADSPSSPSLSFSLSSHFEVHCSLIYLSLLSTYLHYSIFKRHVSAISSFSLSKWTKAQAHKRSRKMNDEKCKTTMRRDEREKRSDRQRRQWQQQRVYRHTQLVERKRKCRWCCCCCCLLLPAILNVKWWDCMCVFRFIDNTNKSVEVISLFNAVTFLIEIITRGILSTFQCSRHTM